MRGLTFRTREVFATLNQLILACEIKLLPTKRQSVGGKERSPFKGKVEVTALRELQRTLL